MSLEAVVDNLIDLFKKYSKEGKKGQLSPSEFKDLLEKELSSPGLKDKFSPEEVETLLKELDKNNDDQINFREFCGFVTKLCRASYKLKKQEKEEKK